VANSGNLTPFKPGDIGNPKGINGFTYRDEAEKALAMWCKKHGDEVIERLVKDATKGKGYAMKLVLDRILPVVQKHEVNLPGTDEAALDAALARIAPPSKANGSARGNGADDTPGTEQGGL